MTVTSPTRKRRCRAKDPKHCAVHGVPVTADDLYQSFLQDQQRKPRTKTAGFKANTPAARVNRALNAPMGWTGKEPDWWDKYEQDLAADAIIPTTAQLIDIIDSPMGKLAVVWQEESQDATDRYMSLDSGISVHAMYYKSVATGEDVGYVKQQYMTDATFERTYGQDEFTPFRYKQRFGGHDLGLTERDDEGARHRGAGYANLTGDALVQQRRKVWARVMTTRLGAPVYVNGQHISSYNVNESHAPDDAQVRQDLKRIAKKIQPEIDEAQAYYAIPFVDYSEVDYDELQGKGFGAALYVYTARKLAQRGEVLRGSGVQSDEAGAMWEKFEQHIPQHVKEIKQHMRNQDYVSPTLDFRAA